MFDKNPDYRGTLCKSSKNLQVKLTTTAHYISIIVR